MLSLVAMASAPMASYANADLTTTVDNAIGQMTPGTGLTIENGLFTSTGTPVELTIGKLVKGEYKLTAETMATNVKLTVNGKELTNNVFKLDGETTVTIKAESTDGNGFRVGGFKLELVFDFSAAYSKLNTTLSTAINSIENDTEDFWEIELRKQYYDGLFSRVDAIKDGDQTSYDVYVKEKLYEDDINNSEICKAVNAFAVNVAKAKANASAKDYANGQIETLETALTALNGKLNDNVKKMFETQISDISTEITTFKDGVETAYKGKTAADEFSKAKVDEKVEAINNSMNEVSEAIDVAIDNFDAYTAVKAKVDEADAKYNEVFKSLGTTLAGETYANLWAEALDELTKQLSVINDVKALNGTDTPAATAAVKKQENLEKIAAVLTEIDKINNTYTAKHTALEDAYKILTAEVDGYKTQLADKKKKLQETIGTNKHDKEIAAVETAIAGLETLVKTAYANYTVDVLATDKAYTDKKADVESKLKALTDASDPTIANYDANKLVETSIGNLNKALSAANTAVAKCVSGDKTFNGTTAWSKTAKALEDEITEYEAGAAKAYAEGTSVDYQKNNAEAMEATNTAITSYKNEVEAAFKKYNTVSKAISDNTTNLGKVKAFVGNDGAVTDAAGETYTSKIDKIQERIDALQTALDGAMKNTDGELASALDAVTIDESIAAAIAAITEEQFNADKKTYESTISITTANNQKAYQQSRKDAITERLTKFEADNNATTLGKKYSEIQEELDAVKAKFNAVELPTAEITSENAGEILTELQKINTAFNEIEAELDALDNEVKPIKAAVKANDDQKKAADKRVAALKSTTEKGKVDAEDIKANNEDTSRDAEFTELYDEVIGLIGQQEAAITKSYEAETLVADWQTISAELDKIEGKIKEYAAQATASTENLNARNAQNDAVTAAKFDELIAAEKAKVEKDATGAGQVHFLQVLVDIKDKDIKNLNKNIETNYTNKNSVNYKTAVDNEISRIKTEISGVGQKAKENEASHKAQLEKQKETQDMWDKLFAKLSAEDKSSKLQAYLDRLTDIQVKINEANAAVEKAFGEGKSDANDQTSTYSALQNEIITIESERDGSYNATIAADNEARYDEFVIAIGKTQAKYNEVVNSIAKFIGVSNDYTPNELNTLILNTNQELYAYPEQIRELTKKAGDEYGSIASPNLYDEKKANIEAANALTAEIDKLYTDFTTTANATAKTALQEEIDKANTTLDNAKATLVGYDKKVVNGAFSDIKSIISAAKTSLADPELAVKISSVLGNLAKIESEKLVEKGQEAAAVAEYTTVMEALDKKIASDREEIKGLSFAESNDIDYLAKYNEAVEKYIESTKEGEEGARTIGAAAITNKNMFGENLTAVKNLIEAFKTNNYYDAAKTAAASNAESLESWEKMDAKLREIQEALDAAKVYADEYVSGNSAIESVQDKITEQRNIADDSKKVGTANTVEGDVLDACEDIANEIKGLNALADAAESAALNTAIDELKTEYNKAVAAAGVGDKEVTKYEAIIEGYAEELSDINSEDFEGDKHASYIALEKKIATTRTELANIYDKVLATNTYNSLIASIDEIKTKQAAEVKDLEACNAAVKAAYDEALAGIITKADAVKADVEAAKAENTVLFYNENLKKEIASVAAELDEIAAAIDAMQAPYKANDEAYARLTAELDALQGKYEALANKLAGYDYVDKEAFAEAAKENITDVIEAERKDIEDAYNATELKDMLNADSELKNKTSVETAIKNLDEIYSKVETTGRIKAVKEALTTATNAITNGKFTEEAKNELKAQAKAIQEAITPLENYNEEAATGSITKDIDGNELVGEDGKPVASKTIDFVEEAVPAIFTKVTELNEAISQLKQDTEENSYILGDVNRDGSVFANDYTIICNVALEKETLEKGSVEFLAADINEDDVVNIGDVSAVARIIRNAESTVAKSKAKARRVSSVVTKTNDVVSITSEGEGTKRRIAINLQNAKAYNGCQMDIKLPSGLTISGEDAGSRANGLTLMSNDLANGMHRIILSTLDDAMITEGAGAIVYLDVEVGYSYSGEDIVVSDVLLTDSSARLYSTNGTGGDGTTGIDTITVGEAVKGKIYSVGGKLMNGLKRGVNIIRGNDGSTKKVIVK